MSDTARILLYGLVAAASPTTLLAVLVVLLSGRGRVNGIAFAAGFLFGGVAAFLTAFFVGSTISNEHHGSFRSYAELALGVVLIAVAWRARRAPEPMEAGGRSGMDTLFERLEHIRPALSFSLGVALGVGTKRLIITAVAATTVAFAGLSSTEEAGHGGDAGVASARGIRGSEFDRARVFDQSIGRVPVAVQASDPAHGLRGRERDEPGSHDQPDDDETRQAFADR